MAITGRPLSAKNAKVRIAGTTLYAAEWEVTPESNWLDTTNFESGGSEEQVEGLERCTISISGWWNGSANMHDAPLSVFNGQTLTGVVLYMNGVGSASWTFAFASVVRCAVTARVAERINYRLELKSDGPWSYPTGAVTAT